MYSNDREKREIIMTLAIIGQPYHRGFFNEDGVVAEFFGSGVNELVISFGNITEAEIASFDGTVTAGLYAEDGALVIFLEWAGSYRNVAACTVNTLHYDAADVAEAIDLKPDHRFAVTQVVLERSNNVAKSFRFFTLPPELSTKLVDAVKEQQSGKYSKEEIQNKHLQVVHSQPSDIELINALQIDMFECGR